MVEIFLVEKNGKIFKFYGEGHAGYAVKGEDIVCAAVSAVIQHTAYGILEYLNLKPELQMRDGFLYLDLSGVNISDKERELNALLETLRITLKEIEKEHPNHMKLIEKEVTDV
ncbi:MAG: ribosomal-processing cysteine protease Prp [Fusobacteriota bacterium]